MEDQAQFQPSRNVESWFSNGRSLVGAALAILPNLLEVRGWPPKNPEFDIGIESLPSLDGHPQTPAFFTGIRQIQESDILTSKQVAAMLGASTEVIQAKARKGEIPGRKVGREWRFSRTAVQAWLRKGNQKVSFMDDLRKRTKKQIKKGKAPRPATRHNFSDRDSTLALIDPMHEDAKGKMPDRTAEGG